MSHQPLTPQQIAERLHVWIGSYMVPPSDSLIINELGFYNKDFNSTVDNAFRADVVLASDRLIGFEIKSEKDNLKRWTSQMIAYPNVFDETWLCVHTKHLDSALDITPIHIGILLIDSTGVVSVIRHTKDEVTNNCYDLSSMLWKDELIALADIYNIAAKPRMNKRFIRNLLAEHLSVRQVGDYLISRLKIRKSLELEVD